MRYQRQRRQRGVRAPPRRRTRQLHRRRSDDRVNGRRVAVVQLQLLHAEVAGDRAGGGCTQTRTDACDVCAQELGLLAEMDERDAYTCQEQRSTKLAGRLLPLHGCNTCADLHALKHVLVTLLQDCT